MISKFGKSALSVGFGSLGMLGFKRGMEDYRYQLEKDNIKYNKNEKFFYTESFKQGLLGSCVYMAPILWLPIVCNEIYRLEVNLRDLEDEKNSDRYNKLLY